MTTLAVHSGALGDVILFARLLQRVAGPVTLLAGGAKVRLLAGLGVVARAMDFDAAPMHEVFSDTPLSECRLPATLGSHERLISCFAAGDRRAELRLAALCGAADATFLPIRPPAEFASHLLDLWCDLLGLTAVKRFPAWTVPPDWRQQARAALAGLGVAAGQPFIAIHPGAGSREKCWPADRYLALARRLGQRRAVVFLLGPVELERFAPQTRSEIADQFPTLTDPPLDLLAGVLNEADAYVGNDSGPSHLAGALGAATVALFGPTQPQQFSPLGPRVRAIRGPDMGAIQVEEVVELTTQAQSSQR